MEYLGVEIYGTRRFDICERCRVHELRIQSTKWVCQVGNFFQYVSRELRARKTRVDFSSNVEFLIMVEKRKKSTEEFAGTVPLLVNETSPGVYVSIFKSLNAVEPLTEPHANQ